MPASRRALVVALACLSNFSLSCFAAAQQSDQVVAECILARSAMETDFTPGRDDICRHGACRLDPDGDRPHRGNRSGTYDGSSGGDSSGPIEFACGPGDCRRRGWPDSHHSRVVRSTVRASPDAQRPAHSDPLISAESLGLYQPSGWIPRPERLGGGQSGERELCASAIRKIEASQTQSSQEGGASRERRCPRCPQSRANQSNISPSRSSNNWLPSDKRSCRALAGDGPFF
jgi:hypothetical protein